MSSTSVLTAPLPDYQGFMHPILECCLDEQAHSLRELEEFACTKLNLSPEQRSLLTPKGNKTKVLDRTHWATYYLKRAGCIQSSKRGIYEITLRGKEVCLNNKVIDTKFLVQFEEFREFYTSKRTVHSNITNTSDTEIPTDTPEEVIFKAHQALITSLADELLEKIKTAITPKQFETLVVDVLAAMGYGGGQSRKSELIEVTSYSNDKGIDGIIKEDALGLEQIYIQAKRYTQGSVGRPEVQNFAGSMDGPGGKKGILITTSTFTKEAVEFAASAGGKRIILIDGQKLAMLMIENGVGVSEETRYVIHKLDNDYFDAFA
jgi:restriction system protein